MAVRTRPSSHFLFIVDSPFLFPHLCHKSSKSRKYFFDRNPQHQKAAILMPHSDLVPCTTRHPGPSLSFRASTKMLRYLQPTLLIAHLPLVMSSHIGYSVPGLVNLPIRTTLLTRFTLSSSNTAPQTTPLIVSIGFSTVPITVTDCPPHAISTSVLTASSAVATTTYSVSTHACEPQASSNDLARTGNFTISSYLPSHPVSTTTSSTSASDHPGLRLPPWHFLTKNGFHVSKTAASSMRAATSAPMAAATTCPIWYIYRGGRRCVDFATNVTASVTITRTARAGPSINGTLKMPVFSKPICRKCRLRTLAKSTTSGVATKPNAGSSTATDGEIHRRGAAINSLVRELDLNFTDVSCGTATSKAGLPRHSVHGRSRCGFPLSIFSESQTATTAIGASLSTWASKTYPHTTALASLLGVHKSNSTDGSTETATQARSTKDGHSDPRPSLRNSNVRRPTPLRNPLQA